MPAQWATWAGARPTSTRRSPSARPSCFPTASWCRRAPGSWPTPIRRGSSRRPRRKPRPFSERSPSRKRATSEAFAYIFAVFKLLSTTGEQAIDLQPGRTIVVGRAVTSDIPIYDPTISRRHAELILTDGGVKVKDVGSSNGTFLNGARITEAIAAENDVITFGKVAFRVKEVSAPVARPQVVPSVSAEFTGAKPAGGTIVRQLPVSVSGGVPAIVTAATSGASHLKVSAKSLEELREKKLELLLEAATGELVPRISRGRTAQSSASKHVPQSIARKVVEDRVAILSDNTAADERFKGKSILIQSVRSAMCTPLMGTDQKVLGILYVDNLTATHSFSDDDLKFLIAFGSLAAVAIENSQRSEQMRREALVLSNFQRYFSPNIAQVIAQQQDAGRLPSEKRPVVIFFSDIRGFTPMAETMSPDNIATLLTEYFTEMVELVFEHGGTLDKFMGDAIMALWGAPMAHEDDADRAMHCALDQLEALERLNTKWKEQGRQELGIGIGINFGEVFVGNIGSDRRLEYTVIGDAVNTASRLCSSAGRNEILISEPFFAQQIGRAHV